MCCKKRKMKSEWTKRTNEKIEWTERIFDNNELLGHNQAIYLCKIWKYMDFISKCTHSYVPFILIYFHYYFMCVRSKCMWAMECHHTFDSMLWSRSPNDEKKELLKIFSTDVSRTHSAGLKTQTHIYIWNIFAARMTNECCTVRIWCVHISHTNSHSRTRVSTHIEINILLFHIMKI